MFDSHFIANPYRTYNHLRTTAPLHWVDKFRSGAWLVTRYADVLSGLHDPRLSSQRSHTLTAALPIEVQSEFSKFNQPHQPHRVFPLTNFPSGAKIKEMTW